MPNDPVILRQTVLHKGKKYNYVQLDIHPTRGGADYSKTLVRHPGAVVIVPVLDDGGIVLIRNFRVSVNKYVFELPAGTLEVADGVTEAPEACAARELIEEGGYRAAEIQYLGSFLTSPGLTDEVMHIVGAKGLTHVGQKLEEYEDIEVLPMPAAEVWAAVDRGQIADGKTLAALLIAARKGWIAAS